MTWEIVLAIAGGIVLLAEAINAIYKAIKPIVDVATDVEELKKHDKLNCEAVSTMRELSKAQCQGMISMMNHMIDGNHVDKMKDTRDDMLDLLTSIK